MEGLSMAAFFSAPTRPRSQDIKHEYVPDKDLYYLSGLREKNALLLIFSDTVKVAGTETDEILFLPPKDTNDAVWHGKSLGTEGAEAELGIGRALPNTAFAELEIEPESFDHIYWKNDKKGVIDDKTDPGDLASLLHHFEQETDPYEGRRSFEELHAWMKSMRGIKKDAEVRHLEKAIDVTEEAHRALMRAVEPGMWEYQGEALVEHIFRANGCRGAAFPSILGSGSNSCVLHYQRNGDRMEASDLMVVDIGGEYGEYAADVSRTLPIDGSFSEEQKAIYELVLQAQKAGIEKCRPGERFWAPNQAARAVIAKGLKRLGLIEHRGQVRRYYLHKASHYLGLDVHDAGTYLDLKAGNVLTVEPGIYIPEGSDCDPKWWNIGVRIEDDIMVTQDGPRNLSGELPRETDSIISLMQEPSNFPKFEGKDDQ